MLTGLPVDQRRLLFLVAGSLLIVGGAYLLHVGYWDCNCGGSHEDPTTGYEGTDE